MIVIDSLSKSYRGREILYQVSFRARPGRVTGFVERNGAGKSTTLRCLLGLNHLDGGRALVLDTTRSEERRVGKECRSRWSPYH